MKKWVVCACFFVSFLALVAFVDRVRRDRFVIPPGWPAPVYDFTNNPLSEAGVQLGRQLFYDPILSLDTTISCASCHLQATGFTHVDHDLSHGIQGRVGSRNSMTIMNVAWSTSFMWDGGVHHLDVQALGPITHPDEMGESMAHVVQKLNQSPRYRKLFQEAFGDSIATGQQTLRAIAQFLLTLQSFNSKYDHYTRGEPGGDMTAQEISGLQVFRLHCASCHTEPLFTNQDFANNGLPVDTTLRDIGRMQITGLAVDSLRFKVPTLRNIQFTFPYMHDGRFRKLADVVKHYTGGIVHSPTLDPRLRTPITLTHEQKVDLVAFLLTLTDREFLFDVGLGFPRD